MDRFVTRENIKRYRKLASASTDAIERSRIMKLLAEEEAKLKSESYYVGDSPRGREPGGATTENRGLPDGEGQRSGG